MRPNVEYCVMKIDTALKGGGNPEEAGHCLYMLYDELQRLQGVIDELVKGRRSSEL